jgi:carotenoid cleavage dioxygenase-like enzyme
MPADFPPGCWLRLGPNSFQWTEGFLDGDGMVHCVTFPPTSKATNSDLDGQSQYTSTYVETIGRTLEEKSGSNKKYKGSLGSAPRGYPLVQGLIENMLTFKTLKGQKDTANTALADHHGRVLALMEQSLPSEISIDLSGRVRTINALTDLEGSLSRSDPLTGGTFSAHGRTCPETGDRVHVSYSANEPTVRIDIFGESNDLTTKNLKNNDENKGWKLKRSVSVKLPTGVPVMIHDCALTPNYVVVLDYPLTVRPARMIFDRFPVEYEPENGARIGLVSRNDPSADTLWFDVEPGVILHTVNAYEDAETTNVIFQAGFSKPSGEESFIQTYATTFLHEWELDLKTGKATDRCLNPNVLVDFPVLSKSQVGKRTSSVICGHVSSIPRGLEVGLCSAIKNFYF